MKNEKWDDVHGNTTPDDRMVAFLESPTDSYAILQLREDVDDNIPLMFANYSYLQKKEMEPEIDRYEVVYHGSISMSEDVNRQLEDLYVKFNICRSGRSRCLRRSARIFHRRPAGFRCARKCRPRACRHQESGVQVPGPAHHHQSGPGRCPQDRPGV